MEELVGRTFTNAETTIVVVATLSESTYWVEVVSGDGWMEVGHAWEIGHLALLTGWNVNL